MEIRVQYFGMLAEITGKTAELIGTEEALTVGALRERIREMYPEIAGRKFKVAVNLQISDDFIRISSNSEVALLPPFAGG